MDGNDEIGVQGGAARGSEARELRVDPNEGTQKTRAESELTAEARIQAETAEEVDSDRTRGYSCTPSEVSGGYGFSSSEEEGYEEALAEETAREWYRAAVESSWPFTVKDHILKQGRKRMTTAQAARRDVNSDRLLIEQMLQEKKAEVNRPRASGVGQQSRAPARMAAAAGPLLDTEGDAREGGGRGTEMPSDAPD